MILGAGVGATTIMGRLTLVEGRVGGKIVNVFRYTGCTTGIGEATPVLDNEYTGNPVSIRRAQPVRMYTDTPYLRGQVDGMPDLIADLIIAEISGARPPKQMGKWQAQLRPRQPQEGIKRH